MAYARPSDQPTDGLTPDPPASPADGVVTPDSPWNPAPGAVAAGLPALVAFLLYLPTLMPGPGFWDTAEFQAVGPVLGIAHPTGFPTYTLLGWLASVVLQPFGNPAYRINLLSALLVAAAAGLTTLSAARLTRAWLPALGAGLALATCQIAWWVGQRADPHALHVFFVALILALLVVWAQRHRAGAAGAGSILFAAAIVYGLALGNHALTVLLAPGIAAFLLWVDRGLLDVRRRLTAACAAGLVLTTALLYAYIPIRASMNPPLDYAHPDNLSRFLYLVLGQQFHGLIRNPLANASSTLLDIFVGQAGWPVVVLGAVGLVALAAGRSRAGRLGPPLALMTGLWFGLTVIFALGYADAAIDRYYLGPLLVLAVWAAIGLAAAWDATAPLRARLMGLAPSGGAWRLAGVALACVAVLAWPAAQAAQGRSANNASGDTQATAWSNAAFAALPPRAVVVSWWSYSTILWYEQSVAGRRPDILIVDDRTRLDLGYGSVADTVRRFMAEGRPVYLIRPETEILTLEAMFNLQYVPLLPGYEGLWRVQP